MPATGRGFGKVQRAQDALVFVNMLHHIALIKGMIAKGDAIRASRENVICVLCVQAHPIGGVFAVHNNEICAQFVAQSGQVFGDSTAPRAAHHIA
jgi:hypothetical protein